MSQAQSRTSSIGSTEIEFNSADQFNWPLSLSLFRPRFKRQPRVALLWLPLSALVSIAWPMHVHQLYAHVYPGGIDRLGPPGLIPRAEWVPLKLVTELVH
jgi:hypothetical protein